MEIGVTYFKVPLSAGLKVAVMVVVLSTVMTHIPVPEQFPPLQPEKTLPDPGEAAKLRMVPRGIVKVHMA